MKICFLVDDYSVTGGIQRVVSLISSGLTKTNEVHVLSMYQENGNNNLDLYDRKVILKTLILGKKKYIQQCLKMVALIKKYIIENNIDILISSSEMLSPYCYLATITNKVPFICWTHTPALNNVEAKTQSIFKCLGVIKSRFTVALTDDTKEKLSKKYGVNHIVVIPNPIDPKLMKNIIYNPDTNRIISVGRICYQKYYEKLVQVASIVLNKYKNWTWDIYGSGNDFEKINNLIKEKNLQDHLHLMGDTSNIYDLYNDYSLQVMTSRFEGFPMTILEGIANALPIVAFDIPGVNSIVIDNINGLLAKPYDEIEMAKNLSSLIENKPLRIEISNNNLNRRNDFSLYSVIDKWNNLFKTIINNKK